MNKQKIIDIMRKVIFIGLILALIIVFGALIIYQLIKIDPGSLQNITSFIKHYY